MNRDIISSDELKASVLNNYFSKCFNNTIPPLTDSDHATYQHTCSSDYPEHLLCSEDEVLNLLLSLDITKANGPDGISANMLKNTAHSTVKGVTIIFNLSLKNGELPTEWKVSAVNPIPKGTAKTKVANYRPISLLSILSKLLEKHVHKLLLEHMENASPLAPQQWGFRSRRSTVSALIDATYNWAQAIDNGKEICALFFDLRKAFDSVPHRLLLDKLKISGLNEHLIKWSFSYLYSREQYVVLNGAESSKIPVLSGVPQGSVLGPLLFLAYINDSTLEPLDHDTHITLYADDILLYRTITAPSDYEILQNDINTLSNWVSNNNLTLNPSKCKYLVISKLRKHSVEVPVLTLNNEVLEKVSSFKYLGINITDDLSWSTHISVIARKARKVLGLLYRQFSAWSPPEVLLQLYKSLVRPHLEYASQVWNPHLIKDIDQLESIQKFALKVCFKQWDSSYSDLLQSSNLPTLSHRRKYLGLCYFYKLVNNIFEFPQCPLTLRVLNYPNRNGRADLFVQPHANSNTYHNSFFPLTIPQWNSLPICVASAPSIFSFKRQLSNVVFCS